MTDAPAHLSDEGITAVPFSGAGLKIHLNAARRKPVAPTIAGLVLTAIALSIILLSPNDIATRIATTAFAAIFFFIGGVFDYIALYLWLVSQDVTINLDSILLQRRALFVHWSQTFRLTQISQIICCVEGKSKITRNSGQSTEKIYFGVKMTTRDNKTVWLASGVSSQNHADWLANAINQTLGLAGENP